MQIGLKVNLRCRIRTHFRVDLRILLFCNFSNGVTKVPIHWITCLFFLCWQQWRVEGAFPLPFVSDVIVSSWMSTGSDFWCHLKELPLNCDNKCRIMIIELTVSFLTHRTVLYEVLNSRMTWGFQISIHSTTILYNINNCTVLGFDWKMVYTQNEIDWKFQFPYNAS